MKTIKSWIGKNVRIKDEYIKDGWVNIDLASGLSYFDGIESETFKVQMDCYGVDLFPYRNEGIDVKYLRSPSHQIIITRNQSAENDYPFLWYSKYFEIVEL